jgi:hypothetical protein
MLRKQIEDTRAKALSGEGDIESNELRKLLRLERLAKMSENIKPKQKRRRWPIIIMLTATLVIFSSLLFVRKSKTEIELNAKLSSVQFTVPTEQIITKTSGGISEIELGPIDQVNLDGKVFEANSSQVRLSAVAGDRAGKLVLAGIKSQPNTKVLLQHTEVPHQFRISLEAPVEKKIEFEVTVSGPIEITCSNFGRVPYNSKDARQATFTAASNQVEIILTFPAAIQFAMLQDIPVNSISFSQLEAFISPEYTQYKPTSSIISGDVYLGELNGKVINLRAAQRLQLTPEPQGKLHSMIVRDEAIEMRFSAYVKELTTGSDEHPRSLMPTLLEWCMSQQGLILMWGTAIYFFGLLMGGIRWWREKT